MLKHFTPEQMQEIKEYFGLENSKEEYKVKDGFVCEGDMVWWRAEYGPEHVYVFEHLHNIKDYPEVYSINEPVYKVTYLD